MKTRFIKLKNKVQIALRVFELNNEAWSNDSAHTKYKKLTYL